MRSVPCFFRSALLAVWISSPAGPATAQDEDATEPRGFRELNQPGPFRVDLQRVVDGWRFELRWREGPSPRRNARFHLGDVHTASATSTDQPCERAVGAATREFVRGHLRGKRIRVRDIREGRLIHSRVGRLEAGGEDLSTLLLDMGVAIPYHDSPRNSALRRWDCSRNDEARAALEAAGIDVGPDDTG
jgi:hypothetical protein